MKIQWKALIVCILIPLIVGTSSALLTKDGMTRFETIEKPPLSPPAWLFPIVWTILYIAMGTASYLVFSGGKPQRAKTALGIYGIQLVFNFFWSVIFFNLEEYLISFIWLILLWIFIVAAAVLFYSVSKAAGYLMLPYILWVTFAGYLNAGIYFLN